MYSKIIRYYSFFSIGHYIKTLSVCWRYSIQTLRFDACNNKVGIFSSSVEISDLCNGYSSWNLVFLSFIWPRPSKIFASSRSDPLRALLSRRAVIRHPIRNLHRWLQIRTPNLLTLMPKDWPLIFWLGPVKFVPFS
jgi:hypothetical protein